MCGGQSEIARLRDQSCVVKGKLLPQQLSYLGRTHTEACAKSLMETRHMVHE
ncbi:hypothetical protein EXN66_Car012933 [Channa argus]|uniref:Uncharacterized protein n=1 Tax=Channa argus TaxID=215402 RepID=A0A6G1Q4G8_CHAAH|nr:hypothetical protein EXN66_Car012933 [Channa argus]